VCIYVVERISSLCVCLSACQQDEVVDEFLLNFLRGGTGCLTSGNKSFDFGADPAHDRDPFFQGILPLRDRAYRKNFAEVCELRRLHTDRIMCYKIVFFIKSS